MTYSHERVRFRIPVDGYVVSARLDLRTEAPVPDLGGDSPARPPAPRRRKRFQLQALAKTESIMAGHPWNCGYRTWASWGKRFHLRKSAEQALNSARNQHGHRLHFRIAEFP